MSRSQINRPTAAQPMGADDRGCATSVPGARNGLAGATLLMLALGLLRRRRAQTTLVKP